MTTVRSVLPKWQSGYPRIPSKAHHILIYKEGLALFNPWRNQRLKSPWCESHSLLPSLLDHSHRKHCQPEGTVTVFKFWSISHWSSTLMLSVTLMLNALYNSSTAKYKNVFFWLAPCFTSTPNSHQFKWDLQIANLNVFEISYHGMKKQSGDVLRWAAIWQLGFHASRRLEASGFGR